ncbi:MAG: hypothetical protein ACT4P3_06800 [Betaproteobacteria bacterium]
MAKEVVLEERAVWPLAASASTTGRYSGRQPAITAFTATFSTVNSHASRNAVGARRPTTSSGVRRVPRSIAATRSSVGSMTGRKSVHLLSMNSCCRPSSLAGGRRRGVERSKATPFRSFSSSGRVRPSSTSCMKGRFATGSTPSM